MSKLRDQIDSMNTKFEEWKERYDELNGRLIDMSRIECKIKENSKLGSTVLVFIFLMINLILIVFFFKVGALMEENEKLRIINKNSENIIQMYSSEHHQIKRVSFLFF